MVQSELNNEMTQAEFDALKSEIKQYLENVVTPIVNYDYSRYATIIAPILFDLRHAIFMSERENTFNLFSILRKAVEKNEVEKKEA